MKYKDAKSLGRSNIAPFMENEGWRGRHSRRLSVNLNNSNEVDNYCRENGWDLKINNNGHHWIFTKRNQYIEWWPSSAKLVINKIWDKGIHCHDYIKLIQQLKKIDKSLTKLKGNESQP